MLISVDTASDTPIYKQIYLEIVRLIGLGELKEGDDLPTVRGLSQDLGTNPMTVQKAYNLLKTEGFVEVDRRVGVRVSSLEGLKKDEFIEELREKLIEARARDYSKEEITREVEKIDD